jgi:Protein of unknown function (DUF3102)
MEHLPEQPPGRSRAVRTRTRAPGLGDLARQIEAEHRAADDAAHNAIERASACGRLLLQAKERVGHGHWLDWLAEHTTVTPRRAQRYMRIYQHREQLMADATRVSHLSVRAAVAQLSKPRETPTAPSAPSAPTVSGRAPTSAIARGVSPGSRTSTRPVPQQPAPAPDAEPDHLARLLDALATIMELPEPAVLARHVIRRVDLQDQLERAGQYIARLARRVSRARPLALASARGRSVGPASRVPRRG